MESQKASNVTNFETSSASLVGLSADEIQLRAQGHKGQLPRQFSAFYTLALAFSMTNSWIRYSATFILPLYAGGGPTVFFGLIVAAFACSSISVYQAIVWKLNDSDLNVAAGLTELASSFPSNGGQNHFAFMVSLVKAQAFTAFVMGWLGVLAWCLTSASTAVVCSE